MAQKLKAKEENTTLEHATPLHIAPRVEQPFERLEQQFERVFDQLWRRPFPGLFGRESLWPFGEPRATHPAIDVYDVEDALIMKAELPGLSKEDIQIQISGSVLTLKGEKKKEEKVEEKDYFRCERSFGAFSRTMQLPASVMTEHVTATFKNGVLEIRLPKTEEAKKKEIQVPIQ